MTLSDAQTQTHTSYCCAETANTNCRGTARLHIPGPRTRTNYSSFVPSCLAGPLILGVQRGARWTFRSQYITILPWRYGCLRAPIIEPYNAERRLPLGKFEVEIPTVINRTARPVLFAPICTQWIFTRVSIYSCFFIIAFDWNEYFKFWWFHRFQRFYKFWWLYRKNDIKIYQTISNFYTKKMLNSI